jgi:hypothetical protein
MLVPSPAEFIPIFLFVMSRSVVSGREFLLVVASTVFDHNFIFSKTFTCFEMGLLFDERGLTIAGHSPSTGK